MPRAVLSEHEISAFRERICAAATHLFAERGYTGVTLRAVAAEIGCSPMTPYRYFRGKQEIFGLVRASAFRRFAQSLERAVVGTADAERRLRALGRAYVDFALGDPDGYRIMFELHQGSAADHPELLRDGARAWLPIRNAVGQAITARLLRGDPDTVSHLFWAGMHGIVSLELAGKLNLGRDLEQLVEPMLQSLLRGSAAERAAKKEVPS